VKIAEEIRRRMEALELTQSELGRRSGVPQPKISALLRGRWIGRDNLERLLTALGAKGVAWAAKRRARRERP